jgi:hypothetical protein
MVKQVLILEQEAENSIYLNEMNVKEPLVVSILQATSEKPRINNVV